MGTSESMRWNDCSMEGGLTLARLRGSDGREMANVGVNGSGFMCTPTGHQDGISDVETISERLRSDEFPRLPAKLRRHIADILLNVSH